MLRINLESDVCVNCVFLFLFFAGPSDSAARSGHSGDTAAVVVPVLFVLLLCVCGGLVALYVRHRRLQHSFTAFANSHYNSRLGSAIFSSGDELGKSSTPSAHTHSLPHKTSTIHVMVYRLFLLTESNRFIHYTFSWHSFRIFKFGLYFVYWCGVLFLLQKARTTRMTPWLAASQTMFPWWLHSCVIEPLCPFPPTHSPLVFCSSLLLFHMYLCSIPPPQLADSTPPPPNLGFQDSKKERRKQRKKYF